MEDTKKLIEKYKRELMELSKSAPPARESRPAEENPVKAPQIIGYVTEESGEFPAVFDKFITEAVENNEIETVSVETAESMPAADIEENSGSETDEPVINDVVDFPDDIFNNDGAIENDMTQDTDMREETVEPADRENTDNAEVIDEMSQGTGESISNFTIPEYSTLAEFEANNTGGGTLEFRVFAAREALPIEGAKIVVTTRVNGKDHEMFSAVTDSSVETGLQTLPAPSMELSQHSDNRVQPYALYDATVEKEGFAKVILRDIPIFDGVHSIQRVAMMPEAELAGADSSGGSNRQSVEITEVRNAK